MSTGSRSGGNGCLYAALGGGVCLIFAGAAIDLRPPPDASELASDAPASTSNAMPSAPAVALPDTADPLEPAPFVEPAPLAAPAPIAEPLPIVWLAEVEQDATHAAGTPCTLALYVARERGEVLAQRAVIECDGRVLHDSPVSIDELVEVSLGEGRYAYRASVVSTQGGMSASTGEHWIRVGDTAIFVEDLSVPRTWAPLRGASAFWIAEVTHRLRRVARALDVTGEAPGGLRRGASCELHGDAIPRSSHNCRLLLRCGTTILYGSHTSGYNRCTVSEGRIAAADDGEEAPDDTDARVHLDVAGDVLEISDRDDRGAWSARFQLAEDERCERIDDWRGEAVDASGASSTWTMNGTARELRWSDGSSEVLLPVPDCAAGIVELTTLDSSTTYRLFRGSRSLAGEQTIDGQTRRVLWGRR